MDEREALYDYTNTALFDAHDVCLCFTLHPTRRPTLLLLRTMLFRHPSHKSGSAIHKYKFAERAQKQFR